VNRLHGVVCSSGWWARTVERELLPWGLAGVELGEDDPGGRSSRFRAHKPAAGGAPSGERAASVAR
jgi:hypothetical protein